MAKIRKATKADMSAIASDVAAHKHSKVFGKADI